LGYKQVGRGPEVKEHKYDWMHICKSLGFTSIAIDTLLAKHLPADIPSIFYHTQEGAWSLYVDAVTSQAGPSSYCNPQSMVPVITYRPHDVDKRYPVCTPIQELFGSIIPE
jgi:hypothetical protein